jgi:hypothetical protein
VLDGVVTDESGDAPHVCGSTILGRYQDENRLVCKLVWEFRTVVRPVRVRQQKGAIRDSVWSSFIQRRGHGELTNYYNDSEHLAALWTQLVLLYCVTGDWRQILYGTVDCLSSLCGFLDEALAFCSLSLDNQAFMHS